MKTIFSKIFAVIFCSIVLVSAINAQEKPRALKFDEFNVNPENGFYSSRREIDFNARVERFLKHVEKQRDVQVFIFYYQARITEKNYSIDIARQLGNLKYQNVLNDKTKVRQFFIFDGGYREDAAVEFWILPKDAEPPVLTPTVDKSEAVVCPAVSVWGESIFDEDNTLLFRVSIESDKNPPYQLKWKISGGEIVGESNLKEVKIKLNKGIKRATAYVEFENLPYPCPKAFSTSAAVNGKLRLIDDFGREPNGQIKARLDSFFTQLQDNPTVKSYIVNYGSRLEGDKTLTRRITLIKNQIAFRGIDASRITFIDGGYRELEATEIWLSLDDQKPIPKPTVDERFVGIPNTTKKSVRRKSK